MRKYAAWKEKLRGLVPRFYLASKAEPPPKGFRASRDASLRPDSDPSPSVVEGGRLVKPYSSIDAVFELGENGNPKCSDIQATVHHGNFVTRGVIETFEAVAKKHPLERNFSMPRGVLACTTDERIVNGFLKGGIEGEGCRLHLIVHIHSVDSGLMCRYQSRYASDIATSACALSLGTDSPFSEEEVILRATSFPIIRVARTENEGRAVCVVETVILNTDLHHERGFAGLEGNEEQQQQYLSKIMQITKYNACAAAAEKHGLFEDAEVYRKEASRMLDKLDES